MEVLTHKSTPVLRVREPLPPQFEVHILYVRLNCGLIFIYTLVVITEEKCEFSRKTFVNKEKYLVMRAL